MNGAEQLLAVALKRGLRFEVRGDRVTYEGPREAVTDDLLDRLRQHKAEVIRLLRGKVLHTNYGAGYRHPDGTVSDGKPEPMPPPAADWPADLVDLLRRVSAAFEWTDTDRQDFRQWARRSPDGVDDARQFLQSECDKLDVRMVKPIEPRRPAAGISRG